MSLPDLSLRPPAPSELLKGALSIALDAYPSLDAASQGRRIDDLARPLVEQGVSGLAAPAQAIELAAYLRYDCGFRGNEADYYAAENSFINRVLDRRLGIPISLAVVYIEVARRAGVRACGVSFPGHFLVRIDDAEHTVIVDPFSSRTMSRGALRTLLASATQGRLSFDESMLEPTPTRHIIARMLFNLRNIYARQGNDHKLLVTLDRLVDTLPEAVEHRRDRGLACARLGATAAARDDLTAYLSELPHASDAEDVRRVLQGLSPLEPGRFN